MMISSIQSEIHPDMVNPRSVILIRIEEDEVSDADLREIFDLNFCIWNYHDARGRAIISKARRGIARWDFCGFKQSGTVVGKLLPGKWRR